MAKYEDEIPIGKIAIVLAVVLVTLVGGGMWGCPKYDVYKRSLSGQAELAQADYSRRIAVTEAQAKLDAAKLLNQAEVERARGVAEANQIIGDSLKGNEGYLRYLWIQGLQTNQMQVLYIPTEAGLPILEAGQRGASIPRQPQ